MSGVYLRCRGCKAYRPAREFKANHNGRCRCCNPPVDEKGCKGCGETKPIDQFHVDRNSRDGRRKECFDCRNRRNRESWRAKQERKKEREGRGESPGYASDPLQQLITRRWA